MPQAEGLRLKFYGEEKIEKKVLETFTYEGVRQRISCTTNEFSAVCPFSGLPDLARIVLEYMPRSKCVELKSLKYYYLSYRDVGIYQESATSRIYKDLFELLDPIEMKLTVIYQTRGGIDTTTTVSSLDHGK
jgi:7-cyano-7-deazaguanine reductase